MSIAGGGEFCFKMRGGGTHGVGKSRAARQCERSPISFPIPRLDRKERTIATPDESSLRLFDQRFGRLAARWGLKPRSPAQGEPIRVQDCSCLARAVVFRGAPDVLALPLTWPRMIEVTALLLSAVEYFASAAGIQKERCGVETVREFWVGTVAQTLDPAQRAAMSTDQVVALFKTADTLIDGAIDMLNQPAMRPYRAQMNALLDQVFINGDDTGLPDLGNLLFRMASWRATPER